MTNSIHLTSKNWDKEVLEAEKPVVVDFWASWCGPCQMMGPVFEELAGEYHKAGTAKLGKLSTEEEQEIPAQMGVRGIPSLIVFYKGKEVDRIVGFAPKELLKQKIDSIIKQTEGK
jgi:thioredoxin 1